MEEKLRKYILHVKEGSEGMCQAEYTLLVESPVLPTENMLLASKITSLGPCSYMGMQSCEDCPGTWIDEFVIEMYTSKRGQELGLVDKLYDPDTDGYNSHKFKHRL